MKQKQKLLINTKSQKNKLSFDHNSPKLKHSSSLIKTPALIKPYPAKLNQNFFTFLSPNFSTFSVNSKRTHSKSTYFPISPQNSRLIKIPKIEVPEEIAHWRSMKFPLSPDQVLSEFGSSLTPSEKKEILFYPEIYFIGPLINEQKIGSKSLSFDEENGNYKLVIGDHIAFRYEIVEILGSGNFGRVVKVIDHKEKTEIAIKIIKNKPSFNEQARDEIEILEYLKKNNSNSRIIQLIDCFSFRGHICLKFELLYISLYQLLRINKFQGCSMDLVKIFASQILQALSLMDRLKVINCDLKPENILLTSPNSCEIKVIDFGSAVFYEKRVYSYIQSRYYRSPEVVLGLDYSSAIDMWSFGCVIAELATGQPIFPAESEADLIERMIEVIGPPPLTVINKASRKSMYFEEDASIKGKKRVCVSKRLKEVVLGADDLLIDLISSCLEWDQLKRISADKALLHPWFLPSKHNLQLSKAVIK